MPPMLKVNGVSLAFEVMLTVAPKLWASFGVKVMVRVVSPPAPIKGFGAVVRANAVEPVIEALTKAIDPESAVRVKGRVRGMVPSGAVSPKLVKFVKLVAVSLGVIATELPVTANVAESKTRDSNPSTRL